MKARLTAFMLLASCLFFLGGLAPAGVQGDPCALFTPSEIKAVIGASVGKGSGAIAGCQWASEDYESSAQIQIIHDTSYYEPHKGAKDYQELTGVGLYGWSGYEMGGWVASTNTGRAVLLTSVASPTADRETAIKLLRMLMERAK